MAGQGLPWLWLSSRPPSQERIEGGVADAKPEGEPSFFLFQLLPVKNLKFLMRC